MWENDKICSNVYKALQSIEGNVMTAAIYDAPCIFLIINLLYLPTFFSV